MRALDTYTLRARVIPVLVVCLPPLVLLGGGVVAGSRLGIGTGLAITVLAALAGQLGRDRGRALQDGLWKKWGGSPTLVRFRYRDAESPERVARLHRRVEDVLGDPMPTPQEEAADPVAADYRYDDAVARLRALTRDKQRFSLLFAENVNYGQRRNLLGMKPISVVVAWSTLVVSVLLLVLAAGSLDERVARYAPAAVAAALAVGFWTLIVRETWVRLPADAYARQLTESVDVLRSAKTGW